MHEVSSHLYHGVLKIITHENKFYRFLRLVFSADRGVKDYVQISQWWVSKQLKQTIKFDTFIRNIKYQIKKTLLSTLQKNQTCCKNLKKFWEIEI